MQRVETLPVLYNGREEDRIKSKREQEKEKRTERERERERENAKERDESRRFNSRWKGWMEKRRRGWMKKAEEWDGRVGACVPDFWSRSMIFPKRTNEGGGLRIAAMELDLAGGWMANQVARSWKMRLCVLESHSLFRVTPHWCTRRASAPTAGSLSLFAVSTCLSTCAHAIVLYRATEYYPCAPVDLYLTPQDATDRYV